MASDREYALNRILDEVELLISTTTPLPENRTPRCLELLRAAQALVPDKASKTTKASTEPQPDMDDAAKVARQEFETQWRSWNIEQLASWWQSEFWSVGHKRLGRILMDVAGKKSGTPVSGINLDDFKA